MTEQEFYATLQAVGAKIITHKALTHGPGIFADEIGGEGPWYGILFEHGYTYGWVRDIEALYDAEIFARHVGSLVVIRRLARELAYGANEIRRKARTSGLLEAAHLVRHLRPDEACNCGSYLSFHNGVPGHQPGCLVGECIAAADEIEGRAEEVERGADRDPGDEQP